jgi:HemY protein
MIRVIIYLVLIGLLAFVAVWLADRPGDVSVTWQGWRLETSVMMLLVAMATVAVVAVMVWSLAVTIWRSPDTLARYLGARRGVRGYRAVSQGLIAIGSGDVRAARKYVEEANRHAPGEPLTLLLGAQTAQLTGDGAQAERAFHQMANRDDTRLLGLHGLYIEAQRRADVATAQLYAEEAAKHAQVPAWAGQAVLEFRCVTGDWAGAIERLERNMKSGLIDKPTYQRQRAVLLTARALANEEMERDRAKADVLEAVKLAPTLVPAAVLAAHLLGEAGEHRKAGRMIEAAWRANPHPDLAEGYAHLRPGDSARERLARIQSLAEKSPGNIEAALAVGRAALDAQEFAIARQTLSPLAVVPTQRVAALMAELEMNEHNDEGRSREWMARALHGRRDPAWTADGFVSQRWLPISPVTGRLDAFEWKDPLSGLDSDRPVIEASRDGDADVNLPATVERRPAHETPLDLTAEKPSPAPPRAEEARPEPVIEPPPAGPRLRTTRSEPPVSRPPAVIPLVHAPDDPGPDLEATVDPVPETEAKPDVWGRLRQYFKT